jgi:hypothetical protein
MKMTVFRDVAPCSLVETYQSFRGALTALMMDAVDTAETSTSFYHRLQGAAYRKTIISA